MADSKIMPKLRTVPLGDKCDPETRAVVLGYWPSVIMLRSTIMINTALRATMVTRAVYVIRLISRSSTSIIENEETPLNSWKEIPGPSSLPIIGPLLHFMPGGIFNTLNGAELTRYLFTMYGPIVRLDAAIGRRPLLFLFDAESAAQILRGENWLPVRPGFQTLGYFRKHAKDFKNGQPTGLITEHGHMWKKLRSKVNPVLMQPKTIKLYTSALNDVALDMIARMKSQRDCNNRLKGKFDQEMNLWSLESIAVVALGCRLGCLDPDLPQDSPANHLIECVHELFIMSAKLDFKPTIWRYFATPNFKRAMLLYQQQNKLAEHFIDQAVAVLNMKKESAHQKGVLEKLLEIDEYSAVMMATDMLFGGVDTAGNTITATLYLLAINPDKQNKLREELRSDEVKRPYLKACLKESLRLMPVTSGNMRVTSKEYNLLGYKIPPNIEVTFCHQDMAVMEIHFPRSQEYLPERWLVETNNPLSYRQAHPFVYSPFGFGVRTCIGRRIAELEMETFMSRIIENFEVGWFGPPPKVEQTSLNYVKGPYNFTFKDAK